MAGCPGHAAEVDRPALARGHRVTGGRRYATAEAGGVRRTFATCNWHVHWNTAAGQVIPARRFGPSFRSGIPVRAGVKSAAAGNIP